MPLISTQRDPGVGEMIAYLDRWATKFDDWEDMTPRQRFSTLRRAEREAIREQFEECADDFSYAARNYFYITNKKGEDQLFQLWESQWLVLEKYYELRDKYPDRAVKIMLLKARQLGMSMLIEAMIAWRTMFFPNTEAIVVSVDADHSQYLFGLMLHIYDMMPWWLKPEAAALKYEEGLHFDNPDREARRLNPGMNSKIAVQHANQLSGVGQGRRVSAVHGSEYTDWQQKKAEEIIEGDMLHAIADNSNSFAFLESTGRGSGTYSHQLWKTNVRLAERAEWYAMFLPFFFESSRRDYSFPANFKPAKQEVLIAERVKREWVQCGACHRYHIRGLHGDDLSGKNCLSCSDGIMTPVVLDNGQLYWKQIRRQNAEGKGKEALKKHRQEMTVTAEEAWQLSGLQVFDDTCQEMVNYTIRDPNKTPGVRQGFIDVYGRYHGYWGAGDKRGCWCEGCREDHRYEDCNFTVWEMPEPGREYCCGVDVAEGIGEDFSVIFVNKIGRRWGDPDEQVAAFRSNTVEPYDLAFYCDAIGRMYNDALMCIEYNIFRTTGDRVVINYAYPNVFRWKHLDSTRPQSNKWHWYTQYNTKPLLWQTGRKWIKSGLWVIRDPIVLEEMQTFQKDEDDSKSASHERGAHDDYLIAGLIALYCAHEMDADASGRIPIPTEQHSNEPARYRLWCETCGYGSDPDESGRYPWGADDPESEHRCPACHSIRKRAALMEDTSASKVLSDELWNKVSGLTAEDLKDQPLTWDRL